MAGLSPLHCSARLALADLRQQQHIEGQQNCCTALLLLLLPFLFFNSFFLAFSLVPSAAAFSCSAD